MLRNFKQFLRPPIQGAKVTVTFYYVIVTYVTFNNNSTLEVFLTRIFDNKVATLTYKVIFLQDRLLKIAPLPQSEEDLTKLLEDSMTIY